MLRKRVTMGTSVWDEKHEFLFDIDQAKTFLTADGCVSFSFDAETFLGRIHLEDPKSAWFLGYLEQTIFLDLAAGPDTIFELWFSFEIKLLALTSIVDGQDRRFSISMGNVEHLF